MCVFDITPDNLRQLRRLVAQLPADRGRVSVPCGKHCSARVVGYQLSLSVWMDSQAAAATEFSTCRHPHSCRASPQNTARHEHPICSHFTYPKKVQISERTKGKKKGIVKICLSRPLPRSNRSAAAQLPSQFPIEPWASCESDRYRGHLPLAPPNRRWRQRQSLPPRDSSSAQDPGREC